MPETESGNVRMLIFRLAGVSREILALEAGRVTRAIDESELLAEAPYRYGFVECHYSDAGIIGKFAQEQTVRTTTYTAKKARRVRNVASFERSWFAMDVRNGMVALQSRRFGRDSELSMERLRLQFIGAITSLLRATMDNHSISVIPAETIKVVPKSDVWRIIKDANQRITHLVVENIYHQSLVPEYPVFNPDVSKNEFWEQEVAPKTTENLNYAEFKASERGNLAKVHEVRAVASIGDTTHVSFVDKDGHPHQQFSFNGRIDIPSAMLTDTTEEGIDSAFATIAERLPDALLATLEASVEVRQRRLLQ